MGRRGGGGRFIIQQTPQFFFPTCATGWCLDGTRRSRLSGNIWGQGCAGLFRFRFHFFHPTGGKRDEKDDDNGDQRVHLRAFSRLSV